MLKNLKKKRVLTGRGFFLISKVRVAPKLREAMTGHLPSEGSSSLCQSTLSFSLRYRLQSKELKVWPVFSSIWLLSVRSTGCHCSQQAQERSEEPHGKTERRCQFSHILDTGAWSKQTAWNAVDRRQEG